MPVYTYKCNNCDYEFDQRQRMSDNPLTDCPSCNTDSSLRKVVNSVGVVFKGSGFYITDNRNGKARGTAAAPATGSAKESDAKTDTAETKKPDSAPKPAETKATAPATG
jgi:putative FmdB family regulatory protein